MEFKIFGKTITIRNGTERLPRLQDDTAWQEYLAGHGYTVSALTALKVAAVFRCVDIISKTMASLPLHMFIEKDGNKEKAKGHHLYNLVYVQPNRHTTAYEFWQMYISNLLLTRGGFAKIQRDATGKITALWNIPTGCVSPIYTNELNGERYVYVTYGGKTETLRDGDFMYTPSFRFSSNTNAEDPMTIAADVLGITYKANTFAAQAYSGANPGGFIEYPGQLSDTSYVRMKEDFKREYAGVQNAGKWMLVEEGGKATPFTRDMEKAQVLESRKWAVTEISRIFGVPPHLVMDMEHATFSNIEQQSLEYVRDCINPMSVRNEQTMFKDLLTEREKKSYFFKFNTNALLRGDTQTRTQYYNTMRQNGVMNADEIRALEDMNAIPDGLGQIFTVNGNMIPLSSVPQNLPKGAKNIGKE